MEAGFEVPLVVTAPPARRARRAKPTPTPVGLAAERLGLRTGHSIADVAGACGGTPPDCVVVVAFGRMIPADLLARVPMLNLHFSALPRWRGAAPVERALLAGDATVGVSLMAIEPTLDTGPVYWCETTAVGDRATAAEVRAELAQLGAAALVRSLRSGLGEPVPQQGEPTYAHKLNRDDRRLAWDADGAQLARVVRVGGAWTMTAGGMLKVLDAVAVATSACEAMPPDAAAGSLWGDAVRCGVGALRLLTVQPAGRAAMAASDWLRGARLEPGVRLDGG